MGIIYLTPSDVSGIVEVDETYIGGKEANKHEHKKLRQGRGSVGKMKKAKAILDKIVDVVLSYKPKKRKKKRHA